LKLVETQKAAAGYMKPEGWQQAAGRQNFDGMPWDP
jgi:hypothetical protein